MNWYWYVIIVISAVAILLAIYKIFGIDKIREWLLIAVSEAEKEYGSGTGKLKLVYVYDMFIEKFPKLQAIVPYVLFSHLVDQALVVMRKMLENEKIAEIIVGNTKINNMKKGDINE